MMQLGVSSGTKSFLEHRIHNRQRQSNEVLKRLPEEQSSPLSNRKSDKAK